MTLLVAPLEVLTDTRLTDPERRVLLALFSYRGKNTNTVWPSLSALAERAHINDQTRVSKLTKSLADKGWLTKKKRGFTGGNEYTLTVPETALSNLDSDTNLAPDTNLDGDTNSNLDSDTKSNLDSAAKYKEQTIEQTKEQIVADASKVAAVASPAPCPHQQIIDLYHEKCPTLRRVKIWNGEREKFLRARWRENPKHQSLDFWSRFFEYVNNSEFLRGDTGKFVADLEWLVRPSNFAKVVEGKYENREGAA